MINIGTDGACKGNPGPGGWGVAIFEGEDYVKGLCGGLVDTTNNRMELQAFIEAVEWIRNESPVIGRYITLHIDSTYVVKGATEWLPGWIVKDFKGVKNSDLWRRIHSLQNTWSACTLKWVRGHSGDIFNEMADSLANRGYEGTQ